MDHFFQDSHPELALRQALAFPVAASPLALAALLGSSRLLSLVSSGPQKLMLLRSALQELVNGRLQDRTGSTDWIKVGGLQLSCFPRLGLDRRLSFKGNFSGCPYSVQSATLGLGAE